MQVCVKVGSCVPGVLQRKGGLRKDLKSVNHSNYLLNKPTIIKIYMMTLSPCKRVY
jgi:hypothetical protein